MTAPALLDALAARGVVARGVVARAEGGQLKLSPARSLDAALLAEVRAHKAGLLALLMAKPPERGKKAPAALEPLQDLKPSCSPRARAQLVARRGARLSTACGG